MVKKKRVYNILIGQKKKKKLVGVQILIGWRGCPSSHNIGLGWTPQGFSNIVK